MTYALRLDPAPTDSVEELCRRRVLPSSTSLSHRSRIRIVILVADVVTSAVHYAVALNSRPDIVSSEWHSFETMFGGPPSMN